MNDFFLFEIFDYYPVLQAGAAKHQKSKYTPYANKTYVLLIFFTPNCQKSGCAIVRHAYPDCKLQRSEYFRNFAAISWLLYIDLSMVEKAAFKSFQWPKIA